MEPPHRDRRLTPQTPASLAGRLGPYPTSGAASAGEDGRASRYIAEVRRILGRFGVRRHVPAGASLFSPSDRARHLYIIESGRIDASLPDDPGSYPIASFHAGASFAFDLDGPYLAVCEAAEDSVVIDLPYSRLRRLSEQGMELRLLLRQCHAFDLKSFLDVCYPAVGRFRLVQAPGRARPAERDDAESGRREPQPAGHPAYPCATHPPRRRSMRTWRASHERVNGDRSNGAGEDDE